MDGLNFIEGLLESALSEVVRTGGSTAREIVELALDAQVYTTLREGCSETDVWRLYPLG